MLGYTSKDTVDFGRRECSMSYCNLLGCTVIYKGVIYTRMYVLGYSWVCVPEQAS